MWDVSDKYKSAIAGANREWKACVRVGYKNGEQAEFWDNALSDKITIESQCVSGSANDDMIDIGAVPPKVITLTVIDENSSLHRYAGAKFCVDVYLKTDTDKKSDDLSGYEKVPMGVFGADSSSISRIENRITIVGYDGMLSFQYVLSDDIRGLLNGRQATQCAQILAGYSACGFCQDLSELPNGNIPLDFDSPQIETGWDSIMWIAQLMGCFARINRVNCLEFVPIKCEWEFFNEEHTLGTILAARNIQGNERYSTTFSDDRIHIVGVAMDGDDGKPVTCRSGELPDDANITITLEKNPIFARSGRTTYEILSAILDQLQSAYFYGFRTEIQNDPALDAGDVIRLQGGVINGTNKNNDLIGLITHSVWTYRERQTITNVGQVPIIYRDDNANTASVQALNDDDSASLADFEPLFSVPPTAQSQKALKGVGDTAKMDKVNPTGSGAFSLNRKSGTTIGDYSFAEGINCTASGRYSHAEGYYTKATRMYSHAGGKYNKDVSDGDIFVIGNGTSESTRANCFRITTDGEVYALSEFNSSGADYAEYIKPWWDNNENCEDRCGYFVTVKDDKLHFAEPNDYIVGITSGNPSVVGNGDEDWVKRWKRDAFDRLVYRNVEVDDYETQFGEDGEPVEVKVGSHTEKQRVPNPKYDYTQQYIGRKDRSEWSCVGMIGVLPLRDDGTCEPGGFAKCGAGGIATKSDEWECHRTFFVIERVNENVIKVEIR